MILGSQYYRPPFPDKRYWKDDLDRMKASGLNTIQLWVVWAWVEAEPGIFRFEDYDELFEEARKNGLGVVISLIAELQPYWIHRIIPDAYMVDHMGNRVISSNRREANQGLTPGGCTDHPRVRERMKAFITKVVERYKDEDHLIGWDCWNELRWNVNSDGLVCFCPHTLEAFRNWLKAKYKDLDGLNRGWKRRYCSFGDVLPGKLPGRTYTEMMEFQAFIQWRAAEHVKFRAETIKSLDTKHIVTAHAADPCIQKAGDSENHAINRGNDWDLADYLDGLGCSHFPFWFNISPEDFAGRLESTHSAAGDKAWWVSELEGGMVSTGFRTFEPVRAKLQQRWIWNAYSRGAKAVLFWCWRDEVFGRESAGFGIAGSDGYAEERLEAVKKTGKLLERYNDLLEGYKPDRAKVGVIFDPNGYNLEWAEDGAAARARASINGYMEALEKIQVPYTILESAHMVDLDCFKLIILPWPIVIPEETGRCLEEFVNKGGTLLVEGEADAYTTVGFYRYPGEDRGFACRLGIDYMRKRGLTQKEFTVTFEGEDFHLSGDEFFTPLKCCGHVPDAEVLSRKEGGPVRAIRNSLGKGGVIALSDFIGKAYHATRYPDFERFLEKVVAYSEAGPEMTVSAEGPVQWRTGLSGNERMLFIINPGGTLKALIRAPAYLFGTADLVENLKDRSKIPLESFEDHKQFVVEIDEGDYLILRWNKE